MSVPTQEVIVNSKPVVLVDGLRCPRAPWRLLAIAVLSAAFAAPAGAELRPPSVQYSYGSNSGSGSGSQLLGPLIWSSSFDGYSSGAVWSDYGLNRASSSVYAEREVPSVNVSVSTTSIWEDALTLYTPEVAAGAWISMHFSLRLTGHLGSSGSTFTNSHAEVDFNMFNNHEGSFVVQPEFSSEIQQYGGGDAERDIDIILEGVIAAPNGHAFNLSSRLSTLSGVNLWGPPYSAASAQAAFGDSARWLGASVWIDDSGPASNYTITSASGFDYRTPVVPEPASATLLALGLAAVLGAARTRRRAPRQTAEARR